MLTFANLYQETDLPSNGYLEEDPYISSASNNRLTYALPTHQPRASMPVPVAGAPLPVQVAGATPLVQVAGGAVPVQRADAVLPVRRADAADTSDYGAVRQHNGAVRQSYNREHQHNGLQYGERRVDDPQPVHVVYPVGQVPDAVQRTATR